MSEYKHGNWYCKPSNITEAEEIVARAVASGAVDHNRNWAFTARFYGVCDGVVKTYSVGTKYTIEQLREKFPLPGEQKHWNGEGLPPVGWHGECSPDEIKWHECVILPDGFIAHSYTLHGNKFWGVDKADGLIFHPIRSERERWIEDAAVFAHKDAVLTPEQSTYAAGAIYDAIKAGTLAAPEVE